ncbi:Flavin-containing monooxygenase [Bertholletia excelsa]
MERKVAIIGAGISGLLACKYMLSKGYHPLVFEGRSRIGGVWNKTLEITKLQTPKSFYQFSDFSWPSSVTADFPNQHEIFGYLEAYAHHFDLFQHIRFNQKVINITYDGASNAEMQVWTHWNCTGEPFGSNGTWSITVQDTQGLSTEVFQVDFVILCVGRFTDVPNIPDFPADQGPELFHGTVIHSKEYSAMDFAAAREFIKGKKVTVAGFQKHAMDIALESSIANGLENPCTLLYRTEHWNMPDYLPWGIHIAYLYFNRFSELLVHKPGEGVLLWLLATLLSLWRWGVSKFVESDIKRKHRLEKFGMVPKHSFLKEISSCLIATVPDGFYEAVEKGSIILKKAPSFGFCKEGVLIEGKSEPLKTDLVILATGFRGIDKLKDIFVSPTFQDLIVGSPDKIVPLYRECIHPRIPQLAIIGFSESISNLYTSEMRCRWLAELLDGKFKLPSIKEMEKDMAKWDTYMKQSSGEYYRRSCIGALHIWYNDQLCKDMGWNPKRKKGFFSDLFQPYMPMDYAKP